MEYELKCRACERHLGKAYGSTIAELRCANSSCRATTHFKIVQADVSKDIHYGFKTKEVEPKKKEAEVS